jgi:acetyl esterase
MPLDPLVQRVIHHAYQRGYRELPHKTVEEVRRYYQARRVSFGAFPARYEDHEVEGVLIRIHFPPGVKTGYPLIVYLRASGYVVGDIGDTDYFCHALSTHLNCMVAAVEPRLSPEYKFPLPFEDCVKSIHYLYEQRATLKINFNKTAIWGESSGANFAAALSHYLKEKKENLIKKQILFYPVLDRYHSYPSKKAFKEGYLMDETLTNWFFSHYLNHTDQNQDVRVSPLLANSFEKLPATLLVGAQYDPMRDEGTAYVKALVKAGVPVDAIIAPGMIHGFLWYTKKIEAARLFQYYAASWLNDFF